MGRDVWKDREGRFRANSCARGIEIEERRGEELRWKEEEGRKSVREGRK